MTKFLNISTDTSLGGSAPSDDVVASQKAVKGYVDGVKTNIQTQLNGKLNYVVANELPEASASTDGKVYYLVNSAGETQPYLGYSQEHYEEDWAEAILDTSSPTIGGVDIDILVFKEIYQMEYGERSDEWFAEAFDMNPTFTLAKDGNNSVIYWDAYSDVTPLSENIYSAFTFYDEEWEEEIDINDIDSATWDVIYYPGSEYTEYGWLTLKTTNAIGRWGNISGTLSNQTDLKNALNAKQDTISDLADIRSGAEAGATAVQPSDLATVATSGSYTDLSNTPTIPTVNNPTITITQGGVTKGSFTLNQASGDTIALDAGGGSSLDAGMLAPFATTIAPSGWLVCDGSAISRTDYSGLFAAIGTTYGTGDGSTTFNLPDLSGKLPLYDGTATQGTTTNGKAPNIYGTAAPHAGSRGTAGVFTGAFYATGVQEESGASVSGSGGRWGFDAHRCSAVYDGSATGITPAGVYTLWCIKY